MSTDERPSADETSASTEGQTSEQTRNWLERYASAVGTVLLVGYGVLVVLASLGLASLSAIPQFWALLTATVVLLSATQVFGKDVLQAVEQFRSGK